MKRNILALAMASTALFTSTAFAEDVTLTIESWRNDDLALWQEKIIPAFEASHPGIKVKFTPSAPTEYNAVLNSKLDAGSAGDLITCRPFDASLALYDAGHLADLSDMDAMNNFSDVAKRLADGRRFGKFLRADGCRDPRLHLQQGCFQRAGHRSPDDRGRVLRRSRQDQGRRHLYPDGHGHQ